MDWEKVFSVKNYSGLIIIASGIEIPHGTDSYIVEPFKYSEQAIDQLKNFERRGLIEVTNDVKMSLKTKSGESLPVRKVESADGDSGKSHNHFVFDPESEYQSKSINVQEINMGRGSNVEEIDMGDGAKGIVLGELKPSVKPMTKDEALELLNLHWKKFESEVKKIEDVRKLNLLQIVAMENGAAEKKVQIIEERITDLN